MKLYTVAYLLVALLVMQMQRTTDVLACRDQKPWAYVATGVVWPLYGAVYTVMTLDGWWTRENLNMCKA